MAWGTRAVRARGYDGRERKALGAVATHEVLQLDLHLALGHAGTHVPHDVRERGVGDGLGRLHARDLLHVFHGAQVHDEVRRFSQFRTLGNLREGGFEGAKAGERHGVLDAERDGFGLDRRPVGMAGGEGFGDELRVGDPCVVDRDRTFAGSRRARCLAVARVGVQHGIARRNQQRVRVLVVEHAVERGEPGDVRGVAHEERAHARIGAGGAETIEARPGSRSERGAIGRAAHRRPPCSPLCPCP